MTVREFYEAIESDYEEVLGRLCKEERIEKYLRKFITECSMEDFDNAFNSNDFKEAFRVVHSIKGMCLSLGFTKLGEVSSVVCEELRYGPPQGDISSEVENLRKVYTFTTDNIKLISKSA